MLIISTTVVSLLTILSGNYVAGNPIHKRDNTKEVTMPDHLMHLKLKSRQIRSPFLNFKISKIPVIGDIVSRFGNRRPDFQNRHPDFQTRHPDFQNRHPDFQNRHHNCHHHDENHNFPQHDFMPPNFPNSGEFPDFHRPNFNDDKFVPNFHDDDINSEKRTTTSRSILPNDDDPISDFDKVSEKGIVSDEVDIESDFDGSNIVTKRTSSGWITEEDDGNTKGVSSTTSLIDIRFGN